MSIESRLALASASATRSLPASRRRWRSRRALSAGVRRRPRARDGRRVGSGASARLGETRAAFREQAREAPFGLAAGLALLVGVAVTLALLSGTSPHLLARRPVAVLGGRPRGRGSGKHPAELGQWGTEIPTTVSKVVFNSFEGSGPSFSAPTLSSRCRGSSPSPPWVSLRRFLQSVGSLASRPGSLYRRSRSSSPPGCPLARLRRRPEHVQGGEHRPDGRLARLRRASPTSAARRADACGGRGRRTAASPGYPPEPALVAGLMLTLYAIVALVVERGASGTSCRRGRAAESSASSTSARSAWPETSASSGPPAGAASPAFPPTSTRRPSSSARSSCPAPRAALLHRAANLAESFAAQSIRLDESVRRAALVVAALALATVAMILVSVPSSRWPSSPGASPDAPRRRPPLQLPLRNADSGELRARRLFGYMTLLPALVVPGVPEAAARPLRGPAGARRLAHRRAALATGAAAAPRPEAFLPAADAGQAVMARGAGAVPCGTRMLERAHRRPLGGGHGRRSIIEVGAVPPSLGPRRVLPLLVDSREFFRDPQANRAFLAEQDADYVVLVHPGPGSGRRAVSSQPTVTCRGLVAARVRPVLEDDQVQSSPSATQRAQSPARSRPAALPRSRLRCRGVLAGDAASGHPAAVRVVLHVTQCRVIPDEALPVRESLDLEPVALENQA